MIFDNTGVTMQDGRRITFGELAGISRAIIEQSNNRQLYCFDSGNVHNRAHVENTFSNAAHVFSMMSGIGISLEDDPEAVPIGNPTNRLCSYMQAKQIGEPTDRHLRR